MKHERVVRRNRAVIVLERNDGLPVDPAAGGNKYKATQVNPRVLFFSSKAVVSVSDMKAADDWTLQDFGKYLLRS